MNNRILLELGGFPIYGSAAIITLGILLCTVMTMVLYRRNHRSGAAVLFLAVAGFVFGVLFSRVIHWYFNAETYTSLLGALTDYSHGSFCLPGGCPGSPLRRLHPLRGSARRRDSLSFRSSAAESRSFRSQAGRR